MSNKKQKMGDGERVVITLVGSLIVAAGAMVLVPIIVLGMTFGIIGQQIWRYSAYPKLSVGVYAYGMLLHLEMIYLIMKPVIPSIYAFHEFGVKIYNQFIVGNEKLVFIHGPALAALVFMGISIYRTRNKEGNHFVAQCIDKINFPLDILVPYTDLRNWVEFKLKMLPIVFFSFIWLLVPSAIAYLVLHHRFGASEQTKDYLFKFFLVLLLCRGIYNFLGSAIWYKEEFMDSVAPDAIATVGKIDGKYRSLKLSWRDFNHHIHVLGQSGAGKSVLLKSFYSKFIDQKMGLIMVDLKADINVSEEIQLYAAQAGRLGDLAIIDLNYPSFSAGYNPLARGNASELKDKVINSLDWSEVHYKKVSERVLLTLMRVVEEGRDAWGQWTLKDVLSALKKPDLLNSVAKDLPTGLASDVIELSKELKTKEMQKSISGLVTDIELMVRSQFGEILTRKTSVDFLETIRKNQLLYVLLDSQKYSETAIRLAKMMISDIKAASGEISSSGYPKSHQCAVIIDEFADIVSDENAAKSFAGFLNRARSSNIGIIMAHQSLGDFASDQAKKQILDNTETVFSFVQKDPETCEILASIGGTHKVEEKTRVYDNELLWGDMETGRGSIKEVEEFIVHPNVFKNLNTGQAVYLAKKPSRIHKINVSMVEAPEKSEELLSQINKFLEANEKKGIYRESTNIEELAEQMAGDPVIAVYDKSKQNPIVPADFQI